MELEELAETDFPTAADADVRFDLQHPLDDPWATEPDWVDAYEL